MARLLLAVVAVLWLVVPLRVVVARRRSRPDRRLLHALETLGSWQVPPHQPH